MSKTVQQEAAPMPRLLLLRFAKSLDQDEHPKFPSHMLRGSAFGKALTECLRPHLKGLIHYYK